MEKEKGPEQNYQVRVIETVEVERIYTVRGRTPEEAFAKARIGDTVSEETLRTIGVANRTLVED